MKELERAAAAIEQAPLVALAGHVPPDGDALGSMLGMHMLCRSQGKPSVASWPEPFVVAPHYTYLPGLDSVTKPADSPGPPRSPPVHQPRRVPRCPAGHGDVRLRVPRPPQRAGRAGARSGRADR